MTYRARVMIHLSILLLGTVVLVAGLTLFTVINGLRENAKEQALGTASLLANTAFKAQAGSIGQAQPVNVQELVRNAVENGNVVAVFLVQPDGRLHSWSSAGADQRQAIDEYYRSIEVQALETLKSRRQTAWFEGDAVNASAVMPTFDGGNILVLVCKLSTHKLDAAVSSAVRDVAVLSFGVLFAGGLVSTLLAKRVSGPVRKLSEMARVIGAGDFSRRVPVDSNDEVGDLAASFNSMVDSLELRTSTLARTTAEKEVMLRELDIASDIQKSLLPETCPAIPGFDVFARSNPAREVGSDFYDFIPFPDGRWGIIIADVSGKGVPAALLMALSRSLLRAYSEEKLSALYAMTMTNRFLARDTRSGMFVTCFYGILDPATSTLTYVNAGHNPPILHNTAHGIRLLRASGTPLGVLEETEIHEEICSLDKGDLLLMYTDGITEAVNAFDEQFGPDRLEQIAKNSARLTAEEILRRIETAANTFSAGQDQFDDMTTVVLKKD